MSAPSRSPFARARTAVIASLVASLVVSVSQQNPTSAIGASGSQIDIPGPTGSALFGYDDLVLSNGNFVVTDPSFSIPGHAGVGAVYLYSGATNQLISTLRGSTTDDFVGHEGVQEVGSGNFVVLSGNWHNGAAATVGAVTWVNGTTGLSDVVSPTNSIVGLTAGDLTSPGIERLTNGNYVVSTGSWNRSGVVGAGAARWANGNAGGTTGPIDITNSMIGTATGDGVGREVHALTNGNYVVLSPNWNSSRGAATWGDGTTGSFGAVGAANSLIGGSTGDLTGYDVATLSNGNYVIVSIAWRNTALARPGAATWRPGGSASPAVVSTANSLYGGHDNDQFGSRLKALTNGNYAVGSPAWDDGGAADTGAIALGNGTSGTTGLVSEFNSLVGAGAGDMAGGNGITPLTNGNYVVSSPSWYNAGTGATAAGAATWQSGTGFTPTRIDPTNSLVGSHTLDKAADETVALTNGNYVVSSPYWDNGTVFVDAGAATWGNGNSGTVGTIAQGNSLIGNYVSDFTGSDIVPLTNGNYVVASRNAGPSSQVRMAGAVTWRPGTSPSPAILSLTNSQFGSTANDSFGINASALPDGNYVSWSGDWDNGAIADVGIVAWGNGSGGSVGKVTPTNALVGGKANDGLYLSVTVMPDSLVMVTIPTLDTPAGAGRGVAGLRSGAELIGTLNTTRAVVGSKATSGISVRTGYTTNRSVLVPQRSSNIVSLLSAPEFVSLSPARLADTRVGFSTVDGANAGGGQLAAGAVLDLPVVGRGGVVADAAAVSLNVTAATNPHLQGFVTVYPCGSPRPLASNLNFNAGGTTPNAVITKVGAGGHVCLFASAHTDLIVDVNGYFAGLSAYRSINPARVLETRPGEVTADGLQQGGGLVASGSVTELQIAGRVGLPASLASVVLNVTVTDAASAGYATVYPCGSARPTASSLNYSQNATVANLVVSKVGLGGKVCIYSQTATDLIADVDGYFPTISGYVSLTPARLLETRSGLTTVDGQSNGGGLRSGGQVTTLVVGGRGGVPSGAATVILNVTVTEPGGPGYVTVYPCGIDPPLASNLNYVAGDTVPNAVIVKLGTGGNVCLVSSQPTQLVVDVDGFFPS